jgi:hypothetical protein
MKVHAVDRDKGVNGQLKYSIVQQPNQKGKKIAGKQCWGSGSVCFWACRIRIRLYEVRIKLRFLLSSSKNNKKNLYSLLFCDFFMSFYR